MKTLKVKDVSNVKAMHKQLELLKTGGDLDDRDLTAGGWSVTIDDNTYVVSKDEDVLFIKVYHDFYDAKIVEAILNVAIAKEAILVVGSRKEIIPVEMTQSFYTRHKKKILFGVPVLAGIAVAGTCYYMAHRVGLADSAEDLKAVAVDLVDTTAE